MGFYGSRKAAKNAKKTNKNSNLASLRLCVRNESGLKYSMAYVKIKAAEDKEMKAKGIRLK